MGRGGGLRRKRGWLHLLSRGRKKKGGKSNHVIHPHRVAQCVNPSTEVFTVVPSSISNSLFAVIFGWLCFSCQDTAAQENRFLSTGFVVFMYVLLVVSALPLCSFSHSPSSDHFVSPSVSHSASGLFRDAVDGTTFAPSFVYVSVGVSHHSSLFAK